MTTSISVPFHGANLLVIEHQNQPFTPMKTIVEGMGLTWQSQLAKLNSNPERWGITKIVIPNRTADSRAENHTAAPSQEMVCLPLRKLFGWLQTISPNKVRKEIRERIIQFQNECDDVLWQHWTANTQAQPLPAVPAALTPPTQTPEKQLREKIYQLAQLRGVSISVIHEHYRREFNSPLWPDADAFTVGLSNRALKLAIKNLAKLKNASHLQAEAQRHGMVVISQDELDVLTFQLEEQHTQFERLADKLSQLMRQHASLCGRVRGL